MSVTVETGGLSEPKDLGDSCDTSFSERTRPDSRVASEPSESMWKVDPAATRRPAATL